MREIDKKLREIVNANPIDLNNILRERNAERLIDVTIDVEKGSCIKYS